VTPAARRWHAAPAGEDGGAEGGDGLPRVGLPDGADGERRRLTIEALRRVEQELDRTRALLDDVLRGSGTHPGAEDPDAPGDRA
jgi:hypothetical protein